MSSAAWRPFQSPAAFVGVLALHLVLLAGAMRLGVWPERQAPEGRPPLTVQLIRQRLATLATPAHQPPPNARTAPPLRAARPLQPVPAVQTRRPAAAEPALQSITVPTPTHAEPSGPPEPAAAGASAPLLNLTLPRGASAPWRQRAQALDDARSNTPSWTLEQRLAMAIGGDGHWVEEVIDADRRRLRRGDMCIDLQRSAAAQRDPFHPASRDLPWQAGPPTRCSRKP